MNLQRKASGTNGWVSLFQKIVAGPDTSTTTVINPTTAYGFINYEACTAASTLYACTTCFSGRPNNIFSVTLTSADVGAFIGSEIKYCHDNTIADF